MKTSVPNNKPGHLPDAQTPAATEGGLEKYSRIMFSVAVLLLLLVSGLSLNSMLEFKARSERASHTMEVITQAQRVLLDVIEVQAGVRGYIITGEQHFIEPYLAARAVVDADVRRLHKLTMDNPGLQQRVAELETLVAQRLRYAEQQVALRRTQGYQAAQEAVASGKGKAITDQIRRRVEDFVAAEQRLLSQRSQQAKSSGLTAITVIIGFGLLAIIILLIAVLRIRRDTALRKQAEKERDRLFNYALDMYCIAGFDGYFKQINPAWKRTLGWSREEMLNQPYLKFIHPDDHNASVNAACSIEDGNELLQFENRYLCKDGSYKWFSWVAFPQLEEGLIFAVARDITEGKRAQTRLGEIMALQRAILDNAGHAIISTTPDGIITTFNPAAERMLGYTAAEVVGLQTPAIIHETSEVVARAQEFSAELGETIAPGFEVFVARARRNLPNEYEWTYIRKDGTRFPVLLSVTALRDASGEITGFLGMAVDIAQRKQAETALRDNELQLHQALEELRRREEIIRQQAMHDELTGLPNRRLFYDRLSMALSEAQRYKHKVALAFIDLDGFKEINDTLGHDAGDKFLVAIAQQLRAVPRAADTCARLGGDEFALILSNVAEKEQVGLVMQRVLDSLNHEFIIDGVHLRASASIGVAMFPDDAEDATALLKHADMAMYCSKEAGRNAYHFWDEEMAATQHAHQIKELPGRP